MNAREWIVDRAVVPDTVLAGTRIAAVDGRITAIDRQAADPAATRLRGTLLPGFVDLQVNGAGGRSCDEGSDDALDTVAAAVANGGAVAFLPTLITAPWDRLLAQVDAVARWIERWNGRGAEPLGLHLEGPFLLAPGAHDASCFVDPTPARVDELLAAARGKLKLVTLAHARRGAVEATARLTTAGVTVALGHCDRSDGFAACVDAGARAVTHLFNVMGPLHHRDVGTAGLALDDERVACPLIVDGVHVAPPMVRNAFKILGPDRFLLVSDAVGAAGMPDGDYTLSGIRVTAKDGVVRDAKGSLAGSALTMALAARNFLRFVPQAGPWTLARAASTNPATLVGAGHLGALAIGKRAAFTLLGDDGSFSAILA
ncbi:MAG: amidohydrolase family protein [Planctomycetes bacterium]|nr:amidohydrolase family protein [Planctomycetota bacterium]